MKKIKKLVSLFLIFSFAVFFTVSCAEKITDSESQGDVITNFDPYDNVFKEDVPTGKKISVKGKTFYFDKIEIRDKNAEKQVTAENALAQFYMHVTACFSDEHTVEFKDSSRTVFQVPKTEGDRDGNVLTINNTNSDGYTYDVRIEIHRDKIIVIHNGHTYNNPGTYAMITFVE